MLACAAHEGRGIDSRWKAEGTEALGVAGNWSLGGRRRGKPWGVRSGVAESCRR